MRTVRSSGRLSGGGGVCFRGVVYFQGVSAPEEGGVCFLGGVCSQGEVCFVGGCGIPACTEAATPLWTDTRL